MAMEGVLGCDDEVLVDPAAINSDSLRELARAFEVCDKGHQRTGTTNQLALTRRVEMLQRERLFVVAACGTVTNQLTTRGWGCRLRLLNIIVHRAS